MLHRTDRVAVNLGNSFRTSRRGFDTVVQTVSGITTRQGELFPGAEPGPQFYPVSAIDYLTGYLMAFGAMVALARRAAALSTKLGVDGSAEQPWRRADNATVVGSLNQKTEVELIAKFWFRNTPSAPGEPPTNAKNSALISIRKQTVRNINAPWSGVAAMIPLASGHPAPENTA
jgi:hypothetical protein